MTAPLALRASILVSLLNLVSTRRVGVWHLTDVHVDPFYIQGSDATKCYCETTASCSSTGDGCYMANSSAGQVAAEKFGNSEGNCATPFPLYESGLDFMYKQGPNVPLVYFTGDFAEAGASYPCTPSTGQPGAEQQILDVINYDYAELRKRFRANSTLTLGCLGNHDSAPGDVFHAAAEGQSWLYDNLTSLWATDVRSSPAALRTISRGAYYSVPGAAPGLTVIALNINYWSSQNPQLTNATAHAYAEGILQFEWLEVELAAAVARHEAVHILGHQPPVTGGSVARAWLPGLYARFSGIVDRYSSTIKGMFFGHIHTDQWTLVRQCRNSSARSYIGAPEMVCDGAPKGVIIPGVSLTEGWPAMNPGVRMLEFDDVTWELLDMKTYTADLHTANKQGSLDWGLEYSFKEKFGLDDLSPQSFAALHGKFMQEENEGGPSLWEEYIGKGAGSLYCKGYTSETASFKPIYDCLPVTAEGKKVWITTLNGTATAP